ncbi:uncharacterized protein OCT59_006541 [Rhizophagus irregularis]|uniref:uncharacterized protein n=1 Tax=Rhizophagus irregularis TaxID=588596 RepID=UPI0033329636|nr:hypothetical protein OCT59_006541 [Rhizophagus irregularis]
MSESSAKLQDTSSSSIKASNIPTEIVSSDSNENGKEQTSKISNPSAKLQDTSSSSIKASNKPTEIVSSDSNESGKKEQTSKISELNTKLQDTSSLFIKASIKPTGFVFFMRAVKKETSKLQDTSNLSLFIKDFRNKPTGFVSSDDESGKKDHQPSKKKSKMPEKSKKSSSIKASNKSTEVVSSDDESYQPKKNSKNSKKKSKSKKSKKQRKRKQSTSRSDSRSNSSSERTSGLETDSSPAAPRKVTYRSLTELPKDTKDNLRREVKWNIKRMPTGSQLDINKTFESQKDLVTKIIIPVLFKVLDTNAYPVSEGVLYEMIYQRHRHQREDLLKKEKSESEQTEETKRKHGNSRQSEKRIRRTNMVRHLQLLDDPIVSKLKKSELNPIMLKNAYHSPEESEVDSDNDSNENRIVIRDIKWRSDCKPKSVEGIHDDDDDIGHHSRKKPKSVEGIHNDDDDIGTFRSKRKKPKSVEGIHNVK